MNKPSFAGFLRHRFPVWLLLGLVLAFNFAIRWRLRDMPLERDEGEYAYAGQLILQGIPPYQLVDNMKFPGVYYAYSLLMSVFGETAAGIHIGMILVTSLTTILVFLIGCELISAAGGLIAAATFVCLSALPQALGLAGHATHFVSLCVCGGFLALLIARRKKSSLGWLASGTAFGMAVLMVQQAIFFPVIFAAWYFTKEFDWNNARKSVLPAFAFCGGCVLPFLAMALGFVCLGLWDKFVFWTFDYARQYVSIFPLRSAPVQFVTGFQPVFDSGIWVWFMGMVGMILILRKRDWSASMELVVLLFLAGMLATCPGFYFRSHYFLMVMPGLALLNAVAILTLAGFLKSRGAVQWANWLPVCLAGLIIGNLLADNWRMWFEQSPVEISRELYDINPFPESLPIAAYLKAHTAPADTIGILGSEPQIFFLARRHSASGHIYLYPLTEPQPFASQMRKEFTGEIEAARPKYIVFVGIVSSWYQEISLVTSSDPSQSVDSLPAWWYNYSTNYLLAGAVDISDDKPSRYYWDEQLPGRSNFTNDNVLIYLRKQ